MELQCTVQNYSWGKYGSDSLVAKLLSESGNTQIDEKFPYAEFWMGTHVNGPSSLKETGEPLSMLIRKNSQYLGESSIKVFGEQLPYLFKVLSIRTALSIQAHPNKQHAEDLHKKFPDIYKDPNHKPELAIALTPMEALCGFRPIDEIKQFVKELPELRDLIGEDVLKACENSDESTYLKDTFRAVLTTCKIKIQKSVEQLLKRECDGNDKYYLELFKKLVGEYPEDPGCFMIYFLNYLKLNPQEAVFLAANEPHAYLYGDCVECMACSDNVVRAGLTPKYIDIETLCSMLNYKGEKAENKLFKPIKEDNCTVTFRPPVPDFAVSQILVPATTGSYKLIPHSTASIMIVISGSGKIEEKTIQTGTVLFIPSNQENEISVNTDLIMYQAFVNV